MLTFGLRTVYEIHKLQLPRAILCTQIVSFRLRLAAYIAYVHVLVSPRFPPRTAERTILLTALLRVPEED